MVMKRKPEEPVPGAPAWLLTYGDLVTQLLTFFILLFTFSTIDVVRFRDAVISLQGAFGVLSGGPGILNLSDLPTQVPIRSDSTPQSASQAMQLQTIVEEAIAEGEKEQEKKETEAGKAAQPLIATQIEERGLRITFTDKTLFDLGKAELKSDSVPILTNVAQVLAIITNRIQVEGHTDNIPVHSGEFPSNWELSTARATAVVHFLVQEGGITPDRLTASGYGEYHPIVPNDSQENRQKNRRVEILILNEDDEKNNAKSVINN